MNNKTLKKHNGFISTIAVTLLLLLMVIPLSTAEDPTLVQVNPLTTTVSAGQTFTIDILCTPGQMIKAFEFKLQFDPVLLQAHNVTEGDIFSGYPTFFNAGSINNTAGTIIDIYGLIVGNGTVSTPGTLVSVSFTAQAASGSSPVTLCDVGITNETTYIPIIVTNGTVLLREFTLDIAIDGSGSVIKNPNQTTYPYGTMVQLTAVADSGWVFSHWEGDLSGSTNPTSITMTANKSITAFFTQNQYSLTITINGTGVVTKNPDQPTYTYGTVVTLTAIPAFGWMFDSWAGDLTGSQNPTTITITGNMQITANFMDDMAPQISNVTQTTSNPLDTNPLYGWVNISCHVTDNIAISTVILQIHHPDGSWTNVSMTAATAGQYYYNSSTTFSTAGNYSYTIQATDTNTNANTSDVSVFSMPPNWDINNDGTVGILDLVLISNHYGQSGSFGWIREDVDNNGTIEVLDLVYVSNHFGETWWM